MAVRHRKDIIRDARAIRWAIDLQQDLKYAFRMIRRDPALAIVITVTLAFAIGGNSAIFSVVNGVLLRPLDLPHPDRLVVISARTPARAEMPVAYPDLLDWQARQATFDSLAGSLVVGGVLTGGGAPERVFGRAVSRNFFSTLGAPLAAGRTFTEAEDRPGGDRVMVLNYGLWQRRYGGDRGIVGRAFLYNSETYTVVGVLPARFDYYGRSNANN